MCNWIWGNRICILPLSLPSMTLKIFPQDLILAAMRDKGLQCQCCHGNGVEQMFKLTERAGENQKPSESMCYVASLHLKTSHCITDHCVTPSLPGPTGISSSLVWWYPWTIRSVHFLTLWNAITNISLSRLYYLQLLVNLSFGKKKNTTV